uniref:Uncharacterized protein n=1 Tax=viral metagenome TaxID=1070528 RepID=A0A6C0H9R1_9ZZZZ
MSNTKLNKNNNINNNIKSQVENIDDEWEKFISNDYDDDLDIDQLESNNSSNEITLNITENMNVDNDRNICDIPKATEIYISTKSKIAYLNQEIDLKAIFWEIPVIQYSMPQNGVIKKQMKFNSLEKEEVDYIKEKLKNELYYDEHIITSIDNPNGRIKFKDIRKVSVGISKKDIMSYRSKKKSAFYNCFVMILRINIENTFKEFHIKVFNTGKVEIPGIQNDEIYDQVLKTLLRTLQPYIKESLGYLQKSDTVLINSNFNCGFYINREALYDILKMKYNIQCIYDPCSYPGIQCKFYYNPEMDIEIQTGSQISKEYKDKYKQIVEVSFMIFRTGSILIVGMCNENVLYIIYEFIKKMLINEFHNISQHVILPGSNDLTKNKNKKIRKKQIFISV